MAGNMIDPMKMFTNAFGTLAYLADKAEEKEFLKRIVVSLECEVIKDSEEMTYKSGSKIGQLRGYRTNLSTLRGDIFQDIMVNVPVQKGEHFIADVTLLIPDNFLVAKVGIQGTGELSTTGGQPVVPRNTPPVRPHVPDAMAMQGGKGASDGKGEGK